MYVVRCKLYSNIIKIFKNNKIIGINKTNFKIIILFSFKYQIEI